MSTALNRSLVLHMPLHQLRKRLKRREVSLNVDAANLYAAIRARLLEQGECGRLANSVECERVINGGEYRRRTLSMLQYVYAFSFFAFVTTELLKSSRFQE
jgi:hypothetical protein